MVRLSIIVPVYNVENYIHKCVGSLLKQDYMDMEILLIDDGSPDKCPEICDMYAKEDRRVRVIHQKNKGVAETRNIGIQEANGEYIAFLDSDDFALPGMISTMMQEIEIDPQTDIVICDYNTFYNDDEDKLVVHHQNISSDWSTKEIRDEYIMDYLPNFMWNKVYRRCLFNGLKIPAGIPYEDLYIIPHVMARAKKIVHVPKAFPCYRLHASSFSTTPKIKKKLGLYLAWREHENVCIKYNCVKPLKYSRGRAQKAAISLQMLNLATDYLDNEQIESIDSYLKNVDSSLLSIRHKLQLWCLNHLNKSVCSFIGKLSILCEDYKQRKLKKR